MPLRSTKKKARRSKKFIKFKLLLDEGLSLPNKYPNLNKNYNLKHIVIDFNHLRGKGDDLVYKTATKENLMMVVYNTKDYKPLIKKDGSSIILLSDKLSNRNADLKICKALKSLSEKQGWGHLIIINNSNSSVELA